VVVEKRGGEEAQTPFIRRGGRMGTCCEKGAQNVLKDGFRENEALRKPSERKEKELDAESG
jgi:hypothetical protein